MKRTAIAILRIFFRDRSSVLIRRFSYYKGRHRWLKKVQRYHNRVPFILDEKSHKERITIQFFVCSLSMWRYEGLINLLLRHPRFNPIIVPFIEPHRKNEEGRRNRDEIYAHFTAKGIPVRDGFDFNTSQYLSIADICPDIVVYTQPYRIEVTDWGYDSYSHDCLFIYTPYGVSTSTNRELKDTYLTNIAWKIFVSCKLEEKIYKDNLSTNKDCLVITGATILDDIANADKQKNPWRSNNKKRLIWAPHHSIDSSRGFSNSNFERMCQAMLDIAKKYQGEIEIAFKPHPVLRGRLNEKWGVERTDKYYAQWGTLPNTIVCEGNYTELFAFSDAMIHDCASFVYEYLCTRKPVMFVCKNDNLLPPAGISNKLGKECFKYHYRGYSMQDIENFITDTVLGGNDTKSTQRELFVQEQIFAPNKRCVAENMLHELEKGLFHETF